MTWVLCGAYPELVNVATNLLAAGDVCLCFQEHRELAAYILMDTVMPDGGTGDTAVVEPADNIGVYWWKCVPLSMPKNINMMVNKTAGTPMWGVVDIDDVPITPAAGGSIEMRRIV